MAITRKYEDLKAQGDATIALDVLFSDEVLPTTVSEDLHIVGHISIPVNSAGSDRLAKSKSQSTSTACLTCYGEVPGLIHGFQCPRFKPLSIPTSFASFFLTSEPTVSEFLQTSLSCSGRVSLTCNSLGALEEQVLTLS